MIKLSSNFYGRSTTINYNHHMLGHGAENLNAAKVKRYICSAIIVSEVHLCVSDEDLLTTETYSLSL